MDTNIYLKKYWKPLSTGVFTLLVFCFWYFFKPHLLIWREQAQLFLCTPEYFLQRLAVPGGLAQYISEFLVQFFSKARHGALILAILLAVVQLLSWQLVKKPRLFLLTFIPSIILCLLVLSPYITITPIVAVILTLATMTVLPRKKPFRQLCLFLLIPIGYWLVGPAILLLALVPCDWRWSLSLLVVLIACVWISSYMTPYPIRQIARGIDYYWEDDDMSTEEEMRYDRWLRLGRWDKIVEASHKEFPVSLSSQNVLRLALWNEKLCSPQDLQECVNPSPKVIKSMSGAFMMSEVYMHVGLVNMSQRAAFEAMESIPNYGKSGRALKRLVETAIVTGQTDIAKKYLSILEKTISYRSWAKGMRPLVKKPDSFKSNPFYRNLHEHYSQTNDFFF